MKTAAPNEPEASEPLTTFQRSHSPSSPECFLIFSRYGHQIEKPSPIPILFGYCWLPQFSVRSSRIKSRPHRVLATVLGLVHEIVSSLDHLVHRRGRGEKRDESHAQGYRPSLHVHIVGDSLGNSVHHTLSCFGSGLGKQNDEFVTSETSQHVCLAHIVVDESSHPCQKLVTGAMP